MLVRTKTTNANLRPAAFDFPLQTLRLHFDQAAKVHYHITSLLSLYGPFDLSGTGRVDRNRSALIGQLRPKHENKLKWLGKLWF